MWSWVWGRGAKPDTRPLPPPYGQSPHHFQGAVLESRSIPAGVRAAVAKGNLAPDPLKNLERHMIAKTTSRNGPTSNSGMWNGAGRLAAWLGREKNGGAGGAVYVTKANTGILDRLFGAMRFSMAAALPRQGTAIVVKIATRAPSADKLGFIEDNVIEAARHHDLAHAKCVPMRGMHDLCVSDVVPRLYFAGLVEKPGRGGLYVTVMGVAPGVTVRALGNGGRDARDTRTRHEPAVDMVDVYLKLERAACAMWAHGVVHGDLHLKNAMYDPATQRLTIIDFGLSSVLPDDVVAKVRGAIARGVRTGVRSLGEVWREAGADFPIGVGLQRHVNKVMSQRSYTWYNPDGYAIMQLYSSLNEAERKEVPVRRAALWGLESVNTKAWAWRA